MNRFNSISRISSAVRRFIFRFSESYDCICASPLSRGVRVVTNVGRRCDRRFLRRWTGDHKADGESVWSRSPDAGINPWVKSPEGRWLSKPRAISRKTIAQGRPGRSSRTFSLHTRLPAPALLFALVFSEGRNLQMPRTFFVARALRGACKSWLVRTDACAEPAPCDGRLSVRMSLPVSMVATAQRLLRRGNILRTFSVSRSSLLLTPLFSHTPQ